MKFNDILPNEGGLTMIEGPFAEIELVPPKTPLVMMFWRLKPDEQDVLLSFYRTSIAAADQASRHEHHGLCDECQRLFSEIIQQFDLIPLGLVDDGWAYFDDDAMRRILDLAATSRPLIPHPTAS
jgi:hypothetical protein